MATASPPDRYLENYRNEVDGAALYRAMAANERSSDLSRLYLRLAQVEEGHAQFWAGKIQALGGAVPPAEPGWRTRVLIWLAGRFGAASVLPMVADEESRNRRVYDEQAEVRGSAMPAQEHSHARLLSFLASRSSTGWNGEQYSRLEGRHGSGAANGVRAMVLGANDGLVSTFCLLMGVAGGAASPSVLLATAVAGALAGACSMAMGEWISVQSAREMQTRQIALEADELAAAPAEEQEELALIYRAKGFTLEEARQISVRVIADKDTALNTLVREELGINPDDLGGSPWVAAGASFGVFLLGAAIPVLPLFVFSAAYRVPACVAASLAGLFAMGALISVFTGKHLGLSGLRQLLVGAAAAALTFGIGWAFDVAIAG